MAVTKDLTKATPYINANSKVAKWEFEYTYENDSDGDATYYKTVFRETIDQADADGNANFALQAKSSFSKADLVSLCSVAQWDAVFASQVDSIITNPVVKPTADESFSIPS